MATAIILECFEIILLIAIVIAMINEHWINAVEFWYSCRMTMQPCDNQFFLIYTLQAITSINDYCNSIYLGHIFTIVNIGPWWVSGGILLISDYCFDFMHYWLVVEFGRENSWGVTSRVFPGCERRAEAHLKLVVPFVFFFCSCRRRRQCVYTCILSFVLSGLKVLRVGRKAERGRLHLVKPHRLPRVSKSSGRFWNWRRSNMHRADRFFF